MHSSLPILTTFLLLLLSPSSSAEHPPGKDAILLSKVHSLTLRSNTQTRSRRVPPIPQLSCVGPSKICKLYQIETMRCVNQGHDYNEEDIQWTCTAPLPPEFKLGATDVVCEGYQSPEDRWVLKGSCGVEYRMLLTEIGEKRFGKIYGQTNWLSSSEAGYDGGMKILGDMIFLGFMVAVCIFILVPLLADCFGWRRNRRSGHADTRWGGFWGGGGGGGGDDGYYPGPPPPYSSCADGSGYTASGRQGWTPGFWTGALGGAAAGYQMGRHAANRPENRRGTSFGRYDAGEGSSSPTRFSSTTTSTGFGSTRRR